jgi:hypothetical protein
MITVMDHDVGTTTTAVVAEALAAIRGQKQNGADAVISHRRRRKRCSMGDAQGTPTLTKMECKDLLISSLSAGNSFASVEHFRKGCKQKADGRCYILQRSTSTT